MKNCGQLTPNYFCNVRCIFQLRTIGGVHGCQTRLLPQTRTAGARAEMQIPRARRRKSISHRNTTRRVWWLTEPMPKHCTHTRTHTHKHAPVLNGAALYAIQKQLSRLRMHFSLSLSFGGIATPLSPLSILYRRREPGQRCRDIIIPSCNVCGLSVKITLTRKTNKNNNTSRCTPRVANGQVHNWERIYSWEWMLLFCAMNLCNDWVRNTTDWVTLPNWWLQIYILNKK